MMQTKQATRSVSSDSRAAPTPRAPLQACCTRSGCSPRTTTSRSRSRTRCTCARTSWAGSRARRSRRRSPSTSTSTSSESGQSRSSTYPCRTYCMHPLTPTTLYSIMPCVLRTEQGHGMLGRAHPATSSVHGVQHGHPHVPARAVARRASRKVQGEPLQSSVEVGERAGNAPG